MNRILTDLSRQKLACACESNMHDWYLRKLRASGNDLQSENGLVWSHSSVGDCHPGLGNNIPFPSFKQMDADILLKKMLAYYHRRSVDAWCTCGQYTTPQHVRQSLRLWGFVFRLPNIGMACRLTQMNGHFRIPRGLKIKIIADIQIFKTYEHPYYGFLNDKFNRDAMKASMACATKYPQQVWIFLATINGVPVGHVMLSVSYGVAGIYEVGVNHQMRRKNIGSAVVLAACQKARELGYKAAVLQSNVGLRSFYQRLGFREVTIIEYWHYSHKTHKRTVVPAVNRDKAQTTLMIEQFLTVLLTGKENQAIKFLKKHPKIACIPLPGFGNVTALHIAAWNGFSDCVRILIELGASLEVRDVEYRGTPLHWAVHGLGKDGPIMKLDHVGAARHMLRAGARVNTVNKWNISPIYLAHKSDCKPMIQLLKSYGAGFSEIKVN